MGPASVELQLKLATSLQRAAYPFGILRRRNFALLWSSMGLSGTAMQMEAVALGWLVLIRTDSPFLVGLIASARMALNFLALFSGAVADRVPRHRRPFALFLRRLPTSGTSDAFS